MWRSSLLPSSSALRVLPKTPPTRIPQNFLLQQYSTSKNTPTTEPPTSAQEDQNQNKTSDNGTPTESGDGQKQNDDAWNSIMGRMASKGVDAVPGSNSQSIVEGHFGVLPDRDSKVSTAKPSSKKTVSVPEAASKNERPVPAKKSGRSMETATQTTDEFDWSTPEIVSETPSAKRKTATLPKTASKHDKPAPSVEKPGHSTDVPETVSQKEKSAPVEKSGRSADTPYKFISPEKRKNLTPFPRPEADERDNVLRDQAGRFLVRFPEYGTNWTWFRPFKHGLPPAECPAHLIGKHPPPDLIKAVGGSYDEDMEDFPQLDAQGQKLLREIGLDKCLPDINLTLNANKTMTAAQKREMRKRILEAAGITPVTPILNNERKDHIRNWSVTPHTENIFAKFYKKKKEIIPEKKAEVYKGKKPSAVKK